MSDDNLDETNPPVPAHETPQEAAPEPATGEGGEGAPDPLGHPPTPPEGWRGVPEGTWVPDGLGGDPIPPEGRAVGSASTARTDNEAAGGDADTNDQTAENGAPA